MLEPSFALVNNMLKHLNEVAAMATKLHSKKENSLKEEMEPAADAAVEPDSAEHHAKMAEHHAGIAAEHQRLAELRSKK